MFNANNFKKEKRNVFGNIVSINMLCVPSERRDAQGYFEVHGLDEVADLRVTPDMYEREYARFKLETERHPTELTSRLLMAHYAGCMQRTDEARDLLAENLKLEPQHPASLMILGLLDLQAGRYDTGWDGYELRHAMKDKAHFGGARKFDCPRWEGQETNETVLIWAEQGFGDNIMFARFMKNVLERAPSAVLEVPPQLYELFETSFIAHGHLVRQHRTPPEFYYHCSLPSLPSVLKLYDEKQLRSPPYIFAEPHMAKVWHERVGAGSSVGVCYKGSPKSERPWSRDIAPELLEPVTQRFDHVIDLTQTGQFESFADTAAAISALDLVITVDTSVYHLAGAMGKEVWLLLSMDPDFRHGLHGSKTIWYDSARLFRQKTFMDWSAVIKEVEAALEEKETDKIISQEAVGL